MSKLKGQGKLTKLFASRIGKFNKAAFAQQLENHFPNLVQEWEKPQVNLEVVSFSSYSDFNEQVLSIFSFLRYIGTPVLWTLYSDGSHTPEQLAKLKHLFEFIKIIIPQWDNFKRLPNECNSTLLNYEAPLLDYAKNHPLGKRLFYYLNYNIERPTIFLDSDILFYEDASILRNLLGENVTGWFLPDEVWGSLDSRYTQQHQEQLYQVNGGFILLRRELVNIHEGLEFLGNLNAKYEYFTEQTVMHIILRANQLMPLDPRRFVISTQDQFDFAYSHDRKDIALRHYTGPVRHKMWQRDWKWHLSLK